MRSDAEPGLIDLGRYPINSPSDERYLALLDRCRGGLEATGACVLDDFVMSERLPEIVAEIKPHIGEAFFATKHHNAYLNPDDPDLPDDHPRNRTQTTDSATLGYSFIPKDSLLNGIYSWDRFVAFVADVLGHDRLYPYADPLAPVNVLVYEKGCQTGWHFDNAAFTVTLLLQESEGGTFEYAPFVRSNEDEAYDTVAEVLEERSDRVQELRQRPGSLVIFTGSRTLHRVTPVTAPRARLVSVFSYSREVGTELDPHTRMTFYGRLS